MRRTIDLLIGAVAILAPALLLLADQVVSAMPPYHHIKITPGLIGVTLPLDPAPSLSRLSNGAWQGDYARMIGTKTPLYPFAVRLKDQLLFTLFGLSGIPEVVVGRGDVLVEQEYLTDYCTRDLPRFTVAAGAWAPRLRQIQDAYVLHGKAFLYVITPSKVAQYPNIIPAGYPCPSTAFDRAALLPAWRHALDEAGVHYVDTTEPVMAAHATYPFKMYPRGGTHWNSVGAMIATRAITTALRQMRVPAVAAIGDIAWTMVPRPIWPDDDLASLMNLLVADRSYPVPRAHVTPPPPPEGCRPLAIAIVGGSFMNRPAENLADGPCHPAVEEFQYWTAFDITWPPGPDGKQPVNPAVRDEKLLDADVLLYEENEQLMAHSAHGPALYALIGKRWGFPGIQH